MLTTGEYRIETSPGFVITVYHEPYPPFLIHTKVHFRDKVAGMAINPMLWMDLEREGCLFRYLDFHLKRHVMKNTARGF